MDVAWRAFDEYYYPFEQKYLTQDFGPLRNNDIEFKKDIFAIFDSFTENIQNDTKLFPDFVQYEPWLMINYMKPWQGEKCDIKFNFA